MPERRHPHVWRAARKGREATPSESTVEWSVGTPMRPARVLVVTDRTAATPALLDAIRARARQGPTRFRVLVPNPAPAEWHPLHPQRHEKVDEAERVLIRALLDIQDAADDAVRGRVSVRHDPMAAIEEMLHDEPFDEIILSVVPPGIERWLHLDLARRVAHLGLPVTTVTEPRAS